MSAVTPAFTLGTPLPGTLHEEVPVHDPLQDTVQLQAIWGVLEALTDPEIPVVTLRELGILRDVRWAAADATWEVVITPTYSGCPAMGQIEDDVRSTLAAAGWSARVITQLAPAWSTDWMSETAKEKLRAYGIAPPQQRCEPKRAPGESVLHFVRHVVHRAHDAIVCPHCGSSHTQETSPFGSTACKALYKCLACQEPFDYFKPY